MHFYYLTIEIATVYAQSREKNYCTEKNYIKAEATLTKNAGMNAIKKLFYERINQPRTILICSAPKQTRALKRCWRWRQSVCPCQDETRLLRVSPSRN